jgi:predicted SAM-dependent methyltransferase
VVPNTEAQMKHILAKPEFDGDEGSMIFGDQNYGSNHHCAAFSPRSATKLFNEAGFVDVRTTPFGEPLHTDMIIEATKPANKSDGVIVAPPELFGKEVNIQEGKAVPVENSPPTPSIEPTKPATEIYNRDYFNAYQGGGFIWDYPSNEVIFRKIVENYRPESVLELGCARGYLLKRFQDMGLRSQGVDVSKHAWLTRVCDPIISHDLTQAPWPLGKKEFDLCVSSMLLEHIPESKLGLFMEELARVNRRGIHAVAVEGQAPNHDATRCTLKTLDWWKRVLPEGHEVVNIKDIGSGDLPEEYFKGDGKVKINLGCAYTMFHQGWVNLDSIDAAGHAQAWKYNFTRHDVKNGLPFGTGTVDRLFAHHVFEHFTYGELARLLKECRRVIRPDGAMRIVVPNAEELTFAYRNVPGLAHYDEVNEGCAKASTQAKKLWAMLAEGHKSFLDDETLLELLEEAGWKVFLTTFRHTDVPAVESILKETIEMTYGRESLFVDAAPLLG